MTFDFDAYIDRNNTRSYKWDQSEKLFGHADIVPLWVADMDFKGPPQVEEALVARAREGVYGYNIKVPSYTEAITGWFSRRHGWDIQASWISDTPSVVTALSLAVECFSKPGDQVVVQPPIYYPFFDVIRMNGREIVRNPLVERGGRYEMNLAHLEELFRAGARLLLFCNPHNPGGRVWTRGELASLAELCERYDVTVVSDEIHCDVIFEGHRYVPFASVSEAAANRTVTCLAPSKTFNMPSLHQSFAVISNERMKRVFDTRVKALSLHMASFFGPAATEAAYTHGDAWLDALLPYLRGNMDYAIKTLRERLPEVKPMQPEGTYLLWIDCRGLGLTVPELKDLMYNRARVALNDGSVYGSEGEGFLRVNVGCPRATLAEGLERFIEAARRTIG